MSDSKSYGSGPGCLGGVVAGVLSWALNHSFWWLLLHALMSWLYVLYALIVRAKEILPALRGMFL